MKSKILVLSQNGNEICRNAEIVDYIDNDGNQYSRAYVGKSAYKIVERRLDCNVWSLDKEH